MDEEQELRTEAADEDDYVRWVAGETLSTLQLRGAQHAATRAGEHEDAEKLARIIEDREQLEKEARPRLG